MKNFYITTTIPYVNADPHIGFALELVQSDAIARYHRLIGEDVFFSTGTDEHGQKIWEASGKEGKKVEDYVDYYAARFEELARLLELSNDNFIRTTNPAHVKVAQEFWRICDAKGDIYKKKYKGLYCVGCEKFLTDRDIVNGHCVIHTNLAPEEIEEENYFFRLSKYKDELLKYLQKPGSIIPEWRRQEAIEFTREAMEDFSISRDKKRFTWGVPVPGDENQVMYVWFDALVNYISSLGWPGGENYQKFWEGGMKVQTAGKDMVKFQSVMWQGMLMSAGLPNTDTIIYHGLITGEGGVKMSKSLGNVINPIELVRDYGVDAVRYFLLQEISSFEDSPFTQERFKEAYNASLANGLGNLASRILTLSEKHLEKAPEIPENSIPQEFFDILETFDVKKAADLVWEKISKLDKKIQDTEPFKLVKTDLKEGKKLISEMVLELYTIARMLNPLLPDTNEKLKKLIRENKKPETPLFPRKD